MVVVYKAEDTKLDRPVALKFLAPHLLRDEEGRKRFEREAKSAAKLDHPNICTVHEIDEIDGRTFIVMAFLEGRPLSERIKEGPLSCPRRSRSRFRWPRDSKPRTKKISRIETSSPTTSC